jgi:uncharacterized repeat protein (TIGR01451 family)
LIPELEWKAKFPMTIALRSRRRAIALTLALVAGVGTLVVSNPAQAQVTDPGTGASAAKNCPGATATLGQTITCTFAVANTGDFPAQVTTLTEQSPFPGGAVVDISCTAGGAVINEGDTLANGVPCAGTFQVTIPNDPTLCGTFVLDRVDLELLYTNFPQPLIAGAFATEVTLIVCPANISITKTADELSKVGDPITYTFEICNDGVAPVNRDSVTDTVLGDITASFPATLAAGACATVELQRTVLDTDPDPLENTVTATYTGLNTSDTATASATTELFQPGVSVSKECSPDPVVVGGVVSCTIVVTNTGSADSPGLVNGTIVDTLTGDLLDPANLAVDSSDCTADLATGASCTIVTTRMVLAADPNPLVNVVTVHYNPDGFPNDITATATDSVAVNPPPGGEGCTPGFWRQPQHFDSWVGFEPSDSFEDVFGVDVTLTVARQTVDDPTLLQAVRAQGGGVNALARHAVAALLNASNPDVASDFTTAQVIALVQAAVASGDFETAKNLLAAANEQGCPLS